MSGGWKQQGKRAKTTLASWCDSNCKNAKIGGLVADGMASSRIVEILKQCRAAGEKLSNAQRTAMEGQLSGAGPWRKVGTDTPPVVKTKPLPAPRTPPSTRRARQAARSSAASAPGLATPRQFTVRVTFMDTDHAGVEVEPGTEEQDEEIGWCCEVTAKDLRRVTVCAALRTGP